MGGRIQLQWILTTHNNENCVPFVMKDGKQFSDLLFTFSGDV